MLITLRDYLANSIRFVRNVTRFGGRFAPQYITLDLEGTFPERRPARQPWWQRLLPFGHESSTSIEQLVEDLEYIASTDRVRGLILRIGSVRTEFARLQSIRDAIRRFRGSGKQVIAYSTRMTLPSYFIATAADEIVAPESVVFDLRGMGVDIQFFGDTLSALGMEIEVEASGEFKTVFDQVQRSSMSEAHRQMLESVLDCQFKQLVAAIACSRNLRREDVLDAINQAPVTAASARNAGLIDWVLYEDGLVSMMSMNGDRIAPLASARRKLRLPYRRHSGQHLGFVRLDGQVVVGKNQHVPLPLPFVQPRAGSESIVLALRRAERNNKVAGILLYVNSGGGSHVAADLIWREVARISKQKPVVAYLADMAASGAYYVAAGATGIVAQPGTVTGSIGSVAFKPTTDQLLTKLKVNHVHLGRGQHYRLWNPVIAWGEQERLKVRELVLEAYALFKRRVAAGRRMTEEEVEEKAQGRLWTGQQALDLNLVDELGDLRAAANKLLELTNLPPNRRTPIVSMATPARTILPRPSRNADHPGTDTLAWLEAPTASGIWAVAPWYPRLRW